MTELLEQPAQSTPEECRSPRALLNAVRPHIKELAYNVLESPGSGDCDIWEREVRLLLRDNTMVRDMAERILGNAVAYILTTMEKPNSGLGVGKMVDVGVHQLILDTPVYFALCDLYNGGVYKHHAPLVERRRDGTVIRTAQVIRAHGFDADEELWDRIDGADCSPCNEKVPDSH